MSKKQIMARVEQEMVENAIVTLLDAPRVPAAIEQLKESDPFLHIQHEAARYTLQAYLAKKSG